MLERNSIYSQRSEVPKKLSTAEKYFVLLELEREPKTVDELPQSFTLPEEALGTFEAAILATSTDGRERSQHIYWEENSRYRASDLIMGTTRSVKSGKNPLSLYFGKKALIFFHTHPGGNFEPSKADIGYFRGFPREAYIFLIGSTLGACAVVQTQESAKLPIWALHEYFEKEQSFSYQDSISDQLKKMGLGFYVWSVGNGSNLSQGGLNDGLLFTKGTKADQQRLLYQQWEKQGQLSDELEEAFIEILSAINTIYLYGSGMFVSATDLRWDRKRHGEGEDGCRLCLCVDSDGSIILMAGDHEDGKGGYTTLATIPGTNGTYQFDWRTKIETQIIHELQRNPKRLKYHDDFAIDDDEPDEMK